MSGWSKVAKFFNKDETSAGDRGEYEPIVDCNAGGDGNSPVVYINDEVIASLGGTGGRGRGGTSIYSKTSAASAASGASGTSGSSAASKATCESFDEDTKSNSNSNSTFDDDDDDFNGSENSSEDEKETIDNIDGKQPPLLGMGLVTISAVCYAALNLSVKALMDETPWQELMIIRMGITWLATLAWILIKYKGQMSLWGPRDKRLLLTWRAFFLWGAMFCCWWSFEFLPVGDGTTLAMSFPMWVAVIAHFVFSREDVGISATSSLNQRLDRWGWICVFSGLVGVIFVAQPSFLFGGEDNEYGPARDVGVILGICSAICAGAQYVIVNYTKEECHWLQVEQITAFLATFVFMPIGFLVFAVVRYYNTGVFSIGWEYLNGFRWAEEVALGLLGFCALALLTRGSQLDAPARTAICLYLQIPVTYLGQCLMTKTLPNYFVIIGMCLVLVSVIVPAARKIHSARKEKAKKQALKEEERKRRELDRLMKNNGSTDMSMGRDARDSDIESDVASTESDAMQTNERDALLDKYRRQGIVTQLNEIPNYTINPINTGNSSVERRGRLKASHGINGSYNSNDYSMSDGSA